MGGLRDLWEDAVADQMQAVSERKELRTRCSGLSALDDFFLAFSFFFFFFFFAF